MLDLFRFCPLLSCLLRLDLLPLFFTYEILLSTPAYVSLLLGCPSVQMSFPNAPPPPYSPLATTGVVKAITALGVAFEQVSQGKVKDERPVLSVCLALIIFFSFLFFFSLCLFFFIGFALLVLCRVR
jgi:hypothetical protein